MQLSARGTGCDVWETLVHGWPATSFSGNVLHPEDADLDGDRFGFWQAKCTCLGFVHCTRSPVLRLKLAPTAWDSQLSEISSRLTQASVCKKLSFAGHSRRNWHCGQAEPWAVGGVTVSSERERERESEREKRESERASERERARESEGGRAREGGRGKKEARDWPS